MALHVRTQLRQAVVALLTGLPTTADRVYRGRLRPLAADHAPSLLVYTGDEDIAITEQGQPAVQGRPVELMIEGRANSTDSAALEDLLDVITAEVEAAVFENDAWSFNGLASHTVLVKTRTRIEAKGDVLNGGIRLEFRVTYSTAEGRPTVAI
jgi:hypothetical protein